MIAAGVTYSGVGTLNLKLGAGGTALAISNTAASATTNVIGSSGSDSITLATDSGPTNLTTSTGVNTIAIATTGAATAITSAAGATNTITVSNAGSIDSISGALTLTGNNSDTLIVDDSASSHVNTATLTPTQLTGLSPATIAFSNLAKLTVNLGAAANNLTITNTAAATNTTVTGGTGSDTITLNTNAGPTRINTGSGTNTVAVLATAAAPMTIASGTGAHDTITLGNAGVTTGIAQPLSILGNGTDIVTVNDSADATARTIVLTSTTLGGITPGLITYSSLATLNVNAGSGNNTVNITSTNSATTSNVTAGSGNDTITLTADSGPTNINTGAGTNTVAIKATSAATSITTATAGVTAFTVTNNQKTDGIHGALTLTGAGSDSMLVDDSSNTVAKTVTLTAASITGASSAAINYSGLTSLTLSLGTAGNTVSITGTAAATTTTLNSGAGNDSVGVSGTTGALTVNTGAGRNAVSLGSNAPSTLSGITGAVTIVGSGSDLLSLDDSGSNTARTGAITSTTLTGFTGAVVNYSGISSLSIALSTAADAVSVQSTNTGTTTILTPGAGANTIVVGSTAPTIGGTMASIAGPLTLVGAGSDALTLDDSADAVAKTATLTPTRLTGVAPAVISFNNLASLNVLLGTGGNNLTVTQTAAATNTSLNVGGGNNTITLTDDSGPDVNRQRAGERFRTPSPTRTAVRRSTPAMGMTRSPTTTTCSGDFTASLETAPTPSPSPTPAPPPTSPPAMAPTRPPSWPPAQRPTSPPAPAPTPSPPAASRQPLAACWTTSTAS